MAATASATVTSAQMVFSREYHQPVVIEIKVTGRNCWRWIPALLRNLGDAPSADACPVFQFQWNLREQFLRNCDACAPAKTFMAGCVAELAIIRTTT
jgi:hypothetical protein